MLKKSKLFLLSSLAINMFPLMSFAAPNASNTLVHPPYRINPTAPLTHATGVTPDAIRNAYGLVGLPNQGEGQIIAIVDAFDAPTAESDLAVFNNQFGLPPCTTENGCFVKIYASGTQPPVDIGWSVEVALDIEWAHAIAPNAKIMLVEAASNSWSDMFTAVDEAVKNGANEVSMSWGSFEFPWQVDYDNYFNAPNVTFIAASGDWGHGAFYPSSSSKVLAVGGTTLNTDSSGNILNETAWWGSGGGLSEYESEPTSQSDYGIPENPDHVRGAPDVAYNADPATGFPIYDSLYGGWFVVGGTSAGAPQWAAIIAIAKSAVPDKQLDVQSMLYGIAKDKYSSTFNDITVGNNGDCGFLCTAQTNYDYVTGLGSPKGQNLIQELINGAYKKGKAKI